MDARAQIANGAEHVYRFWRHDTSAGVHHHDPDSDSPADCLGVIGEFG